MVSNVQHESIYNTMNNHILHFKAWLKGAISFPQGASLLGLHGAPMVFCLRTYTGDRGSYVYILVELVSSTTIELFYIMPILQTATYWYHIFCPGVQHIIFWRSLPPGVLCFLCVLQG